MGRDSGGSNPFAWLAAGAAVIIALAVVVIGVLWIAPDSIGRIRGQGELGVGILVALGVGGYTLALLGVNALQDGFAILMATAGIAVKGKRADVAKREAEAGAVEASTWAPGVPVNGHVNGTEEYTGKNGW